jgi:hypothetical protein
MLKLILVKVEPAKEIGGKSKEREIVTWNSREHLEIFQHLDYGQGTCSTVMFDPDASAEIEYIVDIAEAHTTMMETAAEDRGYDGS